MPTQPNADPASVPGAEGTSVVERELIIQVEPDGMFLTLMREANDQNPVTGFLEIYPETALSEIIRSDLFAWLQDELRTAGLNFYHLQQVTVEGVVPNRREYVGVALSEILGPTPTITFSDEENKA